MIYKLLFTASALKEWRKIAPGIQQQFKKKLDERLHHPRVPSAKLYNMKDCYKIKLKKAGYRLVYRVIDHELIVEVIAVGSRDKGIVHDSAKKRH